MQQEQQRYDSRDSNHTRLSTKKSADQDDDVDSENFAAQVLRTELVNIASESSLESKENNGMKLIDEQERDQEHKGESQSTVLIGVIGENNVSSSVLKKAENNEKIEEYLRTDTTTVAAAQWDFVQKERAEEEFTYEQQHEEARQLITDARNLAKPADLIIQDFSLEDLKPEARMNCGEKRPGTKNNTNSNTTAAKLVKAEMRHLDNQQRQLYLRRALKSQANSDVLLNGSTDMDSSDAFIMEISDMASQSIQLNKLKVVRGKESRCQTSGDLRLSGHVDPNNVRTYNKKANATHHFFNQRAKQRVSQSLISQEFEQTTTVEPWTAPFIKESEWKHDDSIQVRVPTQTKLKTLNQHGKVQLRNSQKMSQEFKSIQVLNNQSVPLKAKLAEKGRKRQLGKALGGSRQQRDQEKQMRSIGGEDKVYFDDKPRTAAQSTSHLRRSTASSNSQKGNLLGTRQPQFSTQHSSHDQSMPLHKYNAAHQVSVRPVSIYNTANKTRISFPQKAAEQSLSAFNIQTDQQIPKLQKKEVSAESKIFKQISKDLKKFKEHMLQNQLDKENRVRPINAADQQKHNDSDFSEAISDLRSLGKCFWRFETVEPAINSALENLEAVMERKRRQLQLYVRQVQGQFDLISDRVTLQRKTFEKMDLHLKREEEFRAKVFNRETHEVMRLIEEYCAMIELGKLKQPEDYRYSELKPDLLYIQTQLENAQVNLDTLNHFGGRGKPASMQIIQDIKDESEERLRCVQINTAQRVIERFYVNPEANCDKATMTQTDALAVFRDHYEKQFDAMLDRETELQVEIKQLQFKIGFLNDKIHLLQRKLDERQVAMEAKDTRVEALEVEQHVLLDKVTNHDREIRLKNVKYEDLMIKLKNKDKDGFERLQKIDKLQDRSQKAEKKCAELEKDKLAVELELIKLTNDNGNFRPKLDELNREIEAKQETINYLREQLKAQSLVMSKQSETAKQTLAVKKKLETEAARRKSQPASIRRSSTQLQRGLTGQSSGKDKAAVKRNLGLPLGSEVIEDDESLDVSDDSKSIVKKVYKRHEGGHKSGQVSVVTKDGSSDSIPKEPQKPIDGRCPQCQLLLILPEIQVKVEQQNEKLINRYSQLVQGRHSSVFANIMKDVNTKVIKYTQQENMDPKKSEQRLSAESKSVSAKDESQSVERKQARVPAGKSSQIKKLGLTNQHVPTILKVPSDRNASSRHRIPSARYNPDDLYDPVELSKQYDQDALSKSKDELLKLRKYGQKKSVEQRKYIVADKNSNEYKTISESQIDGMQGSTIVIKGSKSSFDKLKKKLPEQIPVVEKASQSPLYQNSNQGGRQQQQPYSNNQQQQPYQHHHQRTQQHQQFQQQQPYNQSSISPRDQQMLDQVQDMSHNFNHKLVIEENNFSRQQRRVERKFLHENQISGTIAQLTQSPVLGDRRKHLNDHLLDNLNQRRSHSPNVFNSYSVSKIIMQSKCSVATQTSYNAQDVQRLFLRRMDEILGAKEYRAVSPHGLPRLSASEMDEQASLLANQNSAYRVNWSQAKARVGNVANVKKMRKFQPVRQQRNETEQEPLQAAHQPPQTHKNRLFRIPSHSSDEISNERKYQTEDNTQIIYKSQEEHENNLLIVREVEEERINTQDDRFGTRKNSLHDSSQQ